MKDSIRQRLQKLAERFEEVGRLLATDEVAGGSSQFRELSVVYARYAESKGLLTEVLSESPGEHGGYREIISRIAGRGAFSRLKFESGTHRVQRVPATEAQGRIHTSTCTVAILPELDEVGDIEINPADLRVDTYRSSGAGGQHVNK